MKINLNNPLISESPFFLLTVILSTLLVTLNFLYGKQKIGAYFFLSAILITQLLSALILTRNVRGRLISTQTSKDEIAPKLNKLLEGDGQHDNVKNDQSANNNSIKAALGVIVLLQVASIILGTLGPFLYKNQKIVSVSYFLMILSAHAMVTAITTVFTYNRIVDRKVKQGNHEKILALYPKTEKNNVLDKQSGSLDRNAKLEIGINFCADTITRAADVALNFLYSSSRINVFIYIFVISVLQSLNFALLAYSTYDRFSALKLAEIDNQTFRSKVDDYNKPAIESNLTLMMFIFVMGPIIAIIGKISVPIFYQQNKLSTFSYFALTFVSIIFSSSVSFIFSINRASDTEVTKQNSELIDILIQRDQKHKYQV